MGSMMVLSPFIPAVHSRSCPTSQGKLCSFDVGHPTCGWVHILIYESPWLSPIDCLVMIIEAIMKNLKLVKQTDTFGWLLYGI